MKIDLTSLQYNSSLENGVGTPSWGTSFGQSKPDYFLKNYDRESLVLGLVNNYNENIETSFRGDNNIVLKSLFKNVFLHSEENKIKLNNALILVVIEELSNSHRGRKSLKYNSDLKINTIDTQFENSILYKEITDTLKDKPTDNPCWFVYKIEYFEFDNSINIYVIKVDDRPKQYLNSNERKREWEDLVLLVDKDYLTSEKEISDQTKNIQINLLSKFAKWLNANPKSNYYENIFDKTINGLERINDKYKDSFGDNLFVIDINEIDSKIESINTNILNKDSDFWTFSEATSTHMPRAILNKENYQRFLREFKFNKDFKNTNTIYYGAPGTGKSYKVDQIIKDLDKQFYERITFHPEYDNASFIGGYKPVSVKDEDGNDVIKYEFVPQAFANIYKSAWLDQENQYYLAIEEINRGNCAEIFGELFQLLDRNSGYTVAPSNELHKHLVEELGDENHEGIIKGLQLPPNLAILATMNTSDQSLFPMDSAFKRRWEWEYVPICYDKETEEGKENKSYKFVIDLENGTKYSWIKFIEFINLNHIKENPNLGMDKCIGNYFVKPEDGDSISLKQFINKVIFYLWNDVFKDEDNAVFEENSSYEDFFPITTKGLTKVTEVFDRISLNKIEDKIIEESSIDLAAEPQETYGE